MTNAYIKRLQIKDGNIYANNPVLLMDECKKYFYETNNRVLEEQKYSTKTSEFYSLSKAIIFTHFGLLNYLGMTMADWRKLEKAPMVERVCDFVLQIIAQQNLELAAAGLADAPLVKAVLGIADKVENKNQNEEAVVFYLPDNGRTIQTPDLGAQGLGLSEYEMA